MTTAHRCPLCNGVWYGIKDTDAELDRLRDRCARLEAAINEIDRCFCPMAVSHAWVQAGLDSARKVLEDGTP